MFKKAIEGQIHMNMLVIGNGFDLAHGLPTKYTDFLEFIKVIKQALSKDKLSGIDWGNTDIKVQNLLKSNKGKVQENLFSNRQMWKDLINNNIWIKYFQQCNMNKKENWIDFESEISEVIQSVDKDMHNHDIDDVIENISNDFLMDYHTRRDTKYIVAAQTIQEDLPEGITYKEIRNRLLDDLNRLIRALEIYLCEYIEKIEIKKKSPDIDALDIDHVLSFNYTHTFLKLYRIVQGDEKNFSNLFDYIHGEVSSSRLLEHNNMVLGIDEYLPDERRDKEIDFIAFKKFYQRIYKGTGCKYKEWIDKIQGDYLEYVHKQVEVDGREKNFIPDKMQAMMNRLSAQAMKSQKCRRHNLYIFGHSLDVTDRDILRDLILNDNVYTTIFYHSKEAMGQQIANLVKVIGQDELIKRTGGNTKTIEFKLQQDMVLIND